jgi:hypothetical protein
MEISMRDLFPKCVDVLSDALAPIHYAELTRQALRRLGVANSQTNFQKEIENVREKLLLAEQRGTFYTGGPLYAGALQHWFVFDAQLSMTMDYIEIHGSAKAGADGAFEALMRSPFMGVNNPEMANTERLYRVRSSGLVLEKHVADWFNRRYPEFYSDAENAGKWRDPCSHDFILTVNDRRFLIDVAGPDDRGKYGRRGKKKPTDLHLTCRIHGDNCLFEGVVRGEGFNSSIDPASIFSPTAFVVWLNCAKLGIQYSAVVPRMEHAA